MVAATCVYTVEPVYDIEAEDGNWSCSMFEFYIKSQIRFALADNLSNHPRTTAKAWYLESDVVMHDQRRSEAEVRTMLSSTDGVTVVEDDEVQMILDVARSMSCDALFSGQKLLRVHVSVDILVFDDDEEEEDLEPEFEPASRESIEDLQSFRIKEAQGCCCICCEDFEIGSEATRLPCSHLFHGDCIVKWLQTSRFCPLCRFQMPSS